MIRVELTETGWIHCDLTSDQGRMLAESQLVKVTRPTYGRGPWKVAPASRVGAARVGDIELHVAPKLPIDRVLFLVGYAQNPKGWRDDTVHLENREDLVPAIANALWRQAGGATRRGLLQGYRTIDESGAVMRGRLREADQLRRWHGRALPLELRYDDFTVDIAENRILLGAVTRMLKVPRVDDESRRRLELLRDRLAAVTSPVPGSQLPSWSPTRLNEHYQTAVRLSEIIWQATSPDHDLGPVASSGFMFDLAKIFEAFVTVAFKESVETRFGGDARLQHACYLDEASAVLMKPDLVWFRRGEPAAVLDVKYKQERPRSHPGGDLYQMLAYCTALGVPRGLLVYARGVRATRHVVRRSGVEIVCRALDLSVRPERLLRQIDDLVDEVVRIDMPAT